MPKPAIIIAGVVGVAVIAGGIFLVANKDDKSNDAMSTSTTKTSESSDSSKVAVNDPDGVYDFFSDPSVTKHPEKDVKFGNGQVLSFEYDGSKSNNDASAKVMYDLYYVQGNGSVIPMGGAPLEGTGKGTFMTAESDRVFKSEANGRPGFMELTVTYDTSSASGSITGKTEKLGMYPIVFEVAE